jgi:eukaryotic-like serine/threonine-protein kinase
VYGERRFHQGVVALLGVQKIGRYEILSHLASGGMGQVYLARATGLGGFERQVVVKTLDLSITDDDEAFVTMFLDEARLVGALHHQYIAPVYEVGCDDEGRYYLVMDYVHGETAEAVYRAAGDRSWPVPLNFAITVVSCVASALDYAHNLCAADGTPLDIVHRDISLSNVMVGYDGAVKLIDFGIAKAANRATKTQVGTLKGKIGYLAPEQILRKHVDHRADIFALGIVLYELTTATRAFRENSDLVTLERITNGEIKPPSSLLPDYPPELERIVLKALQVDPDLRFQDAGTMGHELEALAAQVSLPLGHGAVSRVMTHLFGEQHRGRRRMARGSNDVQTDKSLRALDEDEKTPITDLEPIEAMQSRAKKTRERSLKPTKPIAKRADSPSDKSGAAVPLEDLPTPVSEAARSVIEIEDRPFGEGGIPQRPTPTPSDTVRFKTPLPELMRPSPPPGDIQVITPTRMTPVPASAVMGQHDVPTPEERPSPRVISPPPPPLDRKTLPLGLRGTPPPPRVAQHTPAAGMQPVQRMVTGPHLPQHLIFPEGQHLADAPTHITGMRPDRSDPSEAATNITATRPEREDPTDVSGPLEMPLRAPTPPKRHRTATAEIVTPRFAPSTVSEIVDRVEPSSSAAAATRTWLLLCALFAIAVATAIVIAML